MYTHGHEAAVVRSHAARTADSSCQYLLPHLNQSHRLLDVGAGPGSITVDLAKHVAHVVATEIGHDEAQLTRLAVEGAGVSNVDVMVEDVLALSFPDGSFDVVHAHQVLQHVSDPVSALREMARVTKPGGVVAVRDADYGAFTWWPESASLTRWRELYTRIARSNGGEPDAGRRLLAWANAAGLNGAVATSSTWTYADPSSRAQWGESWADRISATKLARQVVDGGLASQAELDAIARGWRDWAQQPDGWFCVPHGEVLWRKP